MRTFLIILSITAGCAVYCYVSEYADYTYYETTIDKIAGDEMIELEGLTIDNNVIYQEIEGE